MEVGLPYGPKKTAQISIFIEGLFEKYNQEFHSRFVKEFTFQFNSWTFHFKCACEYGRMDVAKYLIQNDKDGHVSGVSNASGGAYL